jgi:hypothetical protein
MWTTTTNPVAPGDSLDGFGFSTGDEHPTEDGGVMWYSQSEDGAGGSGFTWGPVLELSTAVPGTRELDADLHHFYGIPNPAHSSVRIRFVLHRAGTARLEVFDAAGRQVRRLLDAVVTAGQHDVVWDGRDNRGHSMPPGSYTYRLIAEGRTLSRRLVLLR